LQLCLRMRRAERRRSTLSGSFQVSFRGSTGPQ
jgi:hypothetical protein